MAHSGDSGASVTIRAKQRFRDNWVSRVQPGGGKLCQGTGLSLLCSHVHGNIIQPSPRAPGPLRP
jgi:hypothetical protein